MQAWRHDHRLTQRQLGEALGYDVTYIAKIEGGARPPSRAFLARLAQLRYATEGMLPPPTVGVDGGPAVPQAERLNDLLPLSDGKRVSPRRQLHGRLQEMQRCLDLLAVARAEGSGVLQVVIGEQGIGKTAFVADLASKAARIGFAVVAGADRRDLAALELPVGIRVDVPIGRALSFGEAEWDALEEVRLSRLMEELRSRALRQPLLVIVENLHDALPSVLSALERIARLDAPLTVVGTARPIPPHSPLAERFDRLTEHAHLEHLRPLSGQAIEAMTREAAFALSPAELAALAHVVFECTAGNPYRAVVLLRLHVDGDGGWMAGHGLEDVWRDGKLTAIELAKKRLARLPRAALAALQCAALVGMTSDVTLLRRLPHMAGADDAFGQLLQPAVDQQLLNVDASSGQVALNHEFIREAVFELTPPLLRHDLHRQIASLLRSPEGYPALPDQLDHAEVTLHHLSVAQRHDRRLTRSVLAWSLWVAQLAIDACDHDRAVHALEVGLAAIPDESTAPVTRATLATLLASQPNRTARRMALLDAFRLLHPPGDEDAELLAEIASHLAYLSTFDDPDPEVLGTLESVLADLPPARTDLVARVEAATCFHLAWTGQFAGRGGVSTIDLSRRALEHAFACNDGKALFQARMARNIALMPTPALDEAVENMEAASDPSGAHPPDVLPLYLRRGDRTSFRAALRRFREGSNVRNPLWQGGLCAQFDACDSFLDGEIADARRHLAVISDVANRIRDDNLGALWLAGWLWADFEAGPLPQLRQACADALALRSHWPSLTAALMMLNACPGGDGEVATSMLEGLLAGGLAAVPRDMSWPVVLALVAETVALLDDRRWAAEIFDELSGYSGQILVLATGLFCIGSADRFLGMLSPLVKPDDPDDAIRRLEVAEELESGLDAPALVARTRYWRARLFARHGRAGEARALLSKTFDEAPPEMVNLRSWTSTMSTQLPREE
ncbi:MAG TPA: helix-turn-helix domain-containing protein [Acidimicrobiales bacterium]|nr:helix-turn-helix domain-containing protein [Acidimicrobiales bacterium]